MKESFFEYYSGNLKKEADIWQNGTLVLDTSVLLGLYRLPEIARQDLISVISLFGDRIWIPYHVGVEFHRNRKRVIDKVNEEFASSSADFEKAFSGIENILKKFQFEKHGIESSTSDLYERLSNAKISISKAINEVKEKFPFESKADPIADQLDVLFSGKIGLPPKDHTELEQIFNKGKLRYECNVPPGYADAKKDKDPTDAVFYFDGLRYQKKYSDLVIWEQFIAHARAQKWQSVVFVTADHKEDWWVLEGRDQRRGIHGPRPELLREMRVEGGVADFWMYTTEGFVRYAKNNTNTKISSTTMEEIEEISRQDQKIPEVNIADVGLIAAGLAGGDSSFTSLFTQWLEWRVRNSALLLSDGQSITAVGLDHKVRFEILSVSGVDFESLLEKLHTHLRAKERFSSLMEKCTVCVVLIFNATNLLYTDPRLSSEFFPIDVARHIARNFGLNVDLIVGFIKNADFNPLIMDLSPQTHPLIFGKSEE